VPLSIRHAVIRNNHLVKLALGIPTYYINPLKQWLLYVPQSVASSGVFILSFMKNFQLAHVQYDGIISLSLLVKYVKCDENISLFLQNRTSHKILFDLFIPTNKLTPWSRVLLEKLRVRSASQEIPLFYGTRRFITVFTRARHLSQS
jgi:hypothetical protein